MLLKKWSSSATDCHRKLYVRLGWDWKFLNAPLLWAPLCTVCSAYKVHREARGTAMTEWWRKEAKGPSWSWENSFSSFCLAFTAAECVVECCQWWAGPGICRRWANSPLRIPTSNTFFFPIFFSTIFYFLFFPLPGYYLEQMSIKIFFFLFLVEWGRVL